MAQGAALNSRVTKRQDSLTKWTTFTYNTGYNIIVPAGYVPFSTATMPSGTDPTGYLDIFFTSLPQISTAESTSHDQAPFVTTTQAPAIEPALVEANSIPYTMVTSNATTTQSTSTEPVEFDYPPTTDPNVPTQWVPVPTSLAMPCYLQVPDTCTQEYNYYEYFYNNFKDHFFNPNGFSVIDSQTLSCESLWSTSLVEWMKTAPTTHVPIVTTPAYAMPTPATTTIISTIYWLTPSILTTTTTFESTWRVFPISWEYTPESTTKMELITYTSIVPGTTSLLPQYPTAYFLTSFNYPIGCHQRCTGPCTSKRSNPANQ
jgi:hypothetical protein